MPPAGSEATLGGMVIAQLVQEVRDLLAGAAAGRGGALVLRGEPGIGRSSALAAAAAAATGFTVLTAPGYPDETAVEFGGLYRLLAALPGGAGARDRPVLCLLDDAHLLDEASRRVLVAVARRIDRERIAVLATAPDTAFGLPSLRLPALDAAASRALLDGRAPGLSGEVATGLIELAGGNPAALVDLATALTPAQRAGAAPPPVCLPADSRLRRHYEAVLAGLPERTRWILLLAAADPWPGPADLFAAADAGDLEPAERAGLVSVTPAGITFAPPVLRGIAYHQAPIARRRAAHAALAPVLGADRGWLPGLLHRAAATAGRDDGLARALTEAAAQGPPPAASAAHRYAAGLTTDPAGAAFSWLAAARASWLAGHCHEAGLLLRRAATPVPALPPQTRDAATAGTALPPETRDAATAGTPLPPETRDAAATVPASRKASPVGRVTAAPAPADRRTVAAGRAVRAQVRRQAGELQLRGGDPDAARETLLDAAAKLLPVDLPAALDALLLAGEAVYLSGRPGCYPQIARRALALRRGDEPPPIAMAFHHVTGLTDLIAGRDAPAFAALGRAVALADRIDDPGTLIRLAKAGILIGDDRSASTLAGRAATLAGTTGALALVPQALEVAAQAELAAGHYAAAAALAADGATRAQATGQPGLAGSQFGVAAVLAALVGDRATATTQIRESAAGGAARSLDGAWSAWALALLDLVEGRPQAAAERLHDIFAAPPGAANLVIRVAATPHLAEAAWHLGGTPPLDTASHSGTFDRWAGHTGQPAWLALRARCRALRAPDHDTADDQFREALHHLQADFPRAHTQLLYGRELRRRRRPADARRHLRPAVETFRLLGAPPWAAEAERELRAAGDHIEPYAVPAKLALTAQQERIARLVTEGATNREVAQELRLSPRTVDHHLRNVFTRLGVRSRTELARVISRDHPTPRLR
jgi:DNA-binding CsgD family transcriptional regulator